MISVLRISMRENKMQNVRLDYRRIRPGDQYFLVHVVFHDKQLASPESQLIGIVICDNLRWE